MPRVRWCPLPILCLIGVCFFWIDHTNADCLYEGDHYDEGVEVATAEPCLNCTCNRGALLCYLRVCTDLPNPPPPGCILLHRYRTCCPELICPDMPNGGNGLEARSEPDGLDIPYDRTILANACVANGTIYGPGSAMDSSTFCEYCYCLGGKQTCVKPKCLLPLPGCTPMYKPTNCCPVHYNCTSYPEIASSSTTTITPKHPESGCVVDGVHHVEGGKVLGVGHSVCDNCYCLRGVLRCEPLSCAPPLLGCTPVIKPGECCAASYNCSGTIEIQPEPNYGQFPTVSKEYAKLRKEVQQNHRKVVTENTNQPFYVIAESSHPVASNPNQRTPGTFGTTRQFFGTSQSTSKPYYYNSMKRESLFHDKPPNYQNAGGVYFATTNYEFQNTNYKRPFSTTSKPMKTTESKLRSNDYLDLSEDTVLSIVDTLLNDRLNLPVDNNTTINDTETQTDFLMETTTLEPEDAEPSTLKLDENLIIDSTTMSTEQIPITTEDFTTTTFSSSQNASSSLPVTVKTVLNSTDCIGEHSNLLEVTTVLPVDANEINKLAEVKTIEDLLTTTEGEVSTEYSTEQEKDVTEVDVESRVKVSSVIILPSIEPILNGTNQEYDYDYGEPGLPPSLPNLRIIPFVAADALDSKTVPKDKTELYTVQGLHRGSTGEFDYNTNLFSPPIETEGGFVPKDPPILENFYENAVTVPSITIVPNTNDVNCLSERREVLHGQSVPSESPCITCTCFYGNIVCQKPPCPGPRPGCRKSSVQDLTLCCPLYICDDEEAPTKVLDRHEGTSNAQEVVTVAEGVVTPDPFRDVIRTEPAPNLQSLIGDMMPFLTRKNTQTTKMESTTPANKNTTNEHWSDQVLQLLLGNTDEPEIEKTTRITTAKPADLETTLSASTGNQQNKQQWKSTSTMKSSEDSLHSNDVQGNRHGEFEGVGLLKLAGCNIYGRMYRVGRIISELSTPCTECKCTEVGVQCKSLC